MEFFRSITNKPVGELMEYIHRTYTYSNDINEILEDLPDYDDNFYGLIRKFVNNQPQVASIPMTRVDYIHTRSTVVINIAYISINGAKKNTKTTISAHDHMNTHDDDRLAYLQLGLNRLVKFRRKYNI